MSKIRKRHEGQRGLWSWPASDLYGFRFSTQSEACAFFFMSSLIWGQSSLQSGSRFSIYISGCPPSRNPDEIGFLIFSICNTEGGRQAVKNASHEEKRSREERKIRVKCDSFHKIPPFF